MKIALITGASQGIGAAITTLLNKNNIKVIFSFKIKKEIKKFSIDFKK